MIKEAIVKIVNKEDLTYDEAYTVMNEIMSGETTPTQNAAFLAALSTKSARAETTDEIAGCAAAMRAHARGSSSVTRPSGVKKAPFVKMILCICKNSSQNRASLMLFPSNQTGIPSGCLFFFMGDFLLFQSL